MPGDGNCLFHALAAQDREARCGEELRAELVDFLERKAGDQDGVEEVWREEAEHLRGAPAERWGGAVAISAYSLLRRRRVFVHVKVAGADAAEVWSNSHPLVDADAPVVHLLYDGVGHYNALVEVELFDEMAPAWPQPPPSLCFAPAPAEAVGAEASGVYAKDEAGVALQSQRRRSARAARSSQAWPRRRRLSRKPAHAAALRGPQDLLKRSRGAGAGRRQSPCDARGQGVGAGALRLAGALAARQRSQDCGRSCLLAILALFVEDRVFGLGSF